MQDLCVVHLFLKTRYIGFKPHVLVMKEMKKGAKKRICI